MAGNAESMTSKNRIDSAEKQRKALDLRKAGIGFEKIAEQLGYASASGAHHAVTRALKKTIQEPADDLRRLELERLDRMQAALWPQVQQGHQGAIDRVLRIMERRARILGLDAPQEQRHTGKNGGPIQHEVTVLDAAVKQIAAERGLDPIDVLAEAERIMAEGRGVET